MFRQELIVPEQFRPQCEIVVEERQWHVVRIDLIAGQAEAGEDDAVIVETSLLDEVVDPRHSSSIFCVIRRHEPCRIRRSVNSGVEAIEMWVEPWFVTEPR